MNITAGLNIPKWNSTVSDLSDDPVINAISKYASHPSIIKIKENRKSDVKFDFSHVLPEQKHITLIISLDTRKSTSGEISTSDLKMAAKYCSD